MKTNLVKALVACMIVAGIAIHGNSAQAGSPINASTTAEIFKLADIDYWYNFEVWAADPADMTRFFLIVYNPDGSVDEYGPYWNEDDARHNRAALDGNVEVVERYVGPQWQYVGIYGTHSEATEIADAFEAFGLLVDVRWIDNPWLKLRGNLTTTHVKLFP